MLNHDEVTWRLGLRPLRSGFSGFSLGDFGIMCTLLFTLRLYVLRAYPLLEGGLLWLLSLLWILQKPLRCTRHNTVLSVCYTKLSLSTSSFRAASSSASVLSHSRGLSVSG